MPMTRLAYICAAALLAALPLCSAQGAPNTKPPEAGERELFNYIRGELLALSPKDGINDNVEVAFNSAKSVLSITQPDGRCDIYLSSIDPNSLVWEVFNPSDMSHTREEILRLTLTPLNGKSARTCFDSHHRVDTNISGSHARLLFSLTKSNAVPNFADDMGKAIKNLIALAPGNRGQSGII